MADKTVLITGTSRGIGLETALYFHEQGWNVIATMRRPEKRKTLLHEKGLPDLVHLDVTDEKSIRDAIQYALDKYGRLDVLVNNAGYALYGLFESLPVEDIKRQFDANLFGMLAVTRAVLPVFRRQRGGTIVNLSSMGGRIAFPLYSVYNSSKFAVEGFTEGLRFELRPHNIHLKLIEPGVIKTDFYGSSMQKPEDPELESAYGDFVRRADRDTENTGLEPRAVARTVYRAALDTSRRLRYIVGLDARTVSLLRWLLPQRLFSWVFEKLIVD
jgi:NAD(P)-dependent dehydrogenase (short-subunit alcohol dehydrogenase family)